MSPLAKISKHIRLMQGNEALAEGALAAGARFFAGYPITPSSEIAEILSEKLPGLGGKFLQMEDEIAAMGAVIGASLTGLKSLTATSGPGFSLKQENLGLACMAEIPCVIVNVMRGGPSTGLPTSPSQSDVMQARWGTHGDHPIIVLVPCSVKETFHLAIRAFNLSEKYRTPVILLSDEIIGHMREPVELPDPSTIEVFARPKPSCPPEEYRPYAHTEEQICPLANFGEGYRYHVTGLFHNEAGFPTMEPELVQKSLYLMHHKIERNLDDIVVVENHLLEDAEIAIFTYGSPARSAKSAIRQARDQGIKVGMLRAQTLWPFPEREVVALCRHARTIIVPELNMGQMLLEVERVVQGRSKVVGLCRYDGEPITPAEILAKIKELI